MTDLMDYCEKLRASQGKADRDLCVRMVGMKRLGAMATKNLEATYQALFT